MNRKDQYLIGLGCMFAAYAYALSGYHTASLFCGVTAAAGGLRMQDEKGLFRMYPAIIAAALVQIILIHLSGIYEHLPETAFLALCNSVFSAFNNEADTGLREKGACGLAVGMMSYLVLVLCFPMTSVFTLPQECLLVCLMFLPGVFGYAIHVLSLQRKHSSESCRMERYNGI